MNWRDMTIGKRVSLGFGVVLALLVVLALGSYIQVGGIVRNAGEVIDSGQLNAELLQREVDHLNWAGKVSAALLSGDTGLDVEIDPRKCGFGKWYYGEGRTHAETQVPDLKPIFAEIEEPHKKLHESAQGIKESLASGKTSEALSQYTEKTLPALKSVRDLLSKLREKARALVISDEAMLAAAAKTRLLIGVTALVALALGGVVGFFIVRGTAAIITRVSLGLVEGADQVAAAAGEVSSSSQTLAQGASRQAAAVEETSASLEEVGSMINQDADNARQADALMKEANQVIRSADESMKKLTSSMHEISAASAETKKIVKTIDDIAFQTNLLALNAAVEAARAGEVGAGFAVVADEVRNLAMRAAEAAQSTSSLIEGTVQKINAGNALVSETSDSFSVATESTTRIGIILSSMADSSTQQSSAVRQVAQAVHDIDSVTQSNAASAEESAAASEELSGQAEMMKNAVAQLLVLAGGSGKGAVSGKRTASPAQSKGPAMARLPGVKPAAKPAAPARKALPPVAKKKAVSTRPEEIIPMDGEFEDF